MRRLISAVCSITSKPSTLAEPEVGGMRPISIRIVVVLPAPFGPRKPKISPRSTVKDTPLTAVERGEIKAGDALYQQLIQELAGLDEKSLVDDLQRTRLLIDPQTPDKENLVWKYYMSVQNELRRRSEERLAHILEQSEEQ